MTPAPLKYRITLLLLCHVLCMYYCKYLALCILFCWCFCCAFSCDQLCLCELFLFCYFTTWPLFCLVLLVASLFFNFDFLLIPAIILSNLNGLSMSRNSVLFFGLSTLHLSPLACFSDQYCKRGYDR